MKVLLAKFWWKWSVVPSLGNDDENDKTDEILHKKQNQTMAVQLMSRFFLHHKNLKKTKDGIWGMTMRRWNQWNSVSNII